MTHVKHSYVPSFIFRTKFASEALTLLHTCTYVCVCTYICMCTYRREQAATRVEHQGEYLCPPPPRQRRYGVQDLYWSPHRARASSREFREERGGGVGTEIGSNWTSERDWRVGKSEGGKKMVILERIEIERGGKRRERAEGERTMDGPQLRCAREGDRVVMRWLDASLMYYRIMTTNQYISTLTLAFPGPRPLLSPYSPSALFTSPILARGCLNASYRIYCFTADANRRELLSYCINICCNVQQMPNFECGNCCFKRANRS